MGRSLAWSYQPCRAATTEHSVANVSIPQAGAHIASDALHDSRRDEASHPDGEFPMPKAPLWPGWCDTPYVRFGARPTASGPGFWCVGSVAFLTSSLI
jgi:hypothetical protein